MTGLAKIETQPSYLKNNKAILAIWNILKALKKVDVAKTSLSEIILMKNMLAGVPAGLLGVTNEFFNKALIEDCTNPTPSGLSSFFQPYPLRDALEEIRNIVTDFNGDMGASIKKSR